MSLVLESQGQPLGDIPPANTAPLLFVSKASSRLAWQGSVEPPPGSGCGGEPAAQPPPSMGRGAWLAPSLSSTVRCTLTLLIYLLLAQGFTPLASTAAFAITY